MDPLTVKLGEAAAKLLVKHGKAGVKRLLTESLLQKAATDTQLEFEGIEIREALVRWSQTDQFVEVLEDLRDGKRNDVIALIPGFIENTDFYAGDETEHQALGIVEAFLTRVLDELYKSVDAVVILAKRQEVLENETQDHVSTEVSKAAERVIAKLSNSEDNYHLLTRLLVGVLKHQVKTYLGDGVVSGLLEADNEHFGERLLAALKEGQSSREQARRIAAALKSAAEELEREQLGLYLRLEDAPREIVEQVVEALANLESGDLRGRQLQSAVQALVRNITETDADNRRRISMQLYQVLLMAILTIPELQPRAQDLLQQSRTWLLSEQIRRIELKTEERALPAATTTIEEVLTSERTSPEQRGHQFRDGDLRAGLVIARETVELVDPIGEGGQASVWRGRLIATGETVAIRFLNTGLAEEPEIVHMFEREVEVLTSLSGNGIPRIVQPITREGGRYFYITDYIEQTATFAQLIHDSDVPVERRLEILCSAAAALHEMHTQGFIHGDVKPENIIVDRDRGVRFIDFGSARKIGHQDAEEPITFTYAYVAPEMLALTHSTRSQSQQSRTQFRTQMSIAPTLDVYPLGIMLFQLLDPGLGRIARMEENALIGRLFVTPELKAVVRRAIAREPSNRFISALDFKEAVEAAIGTATANDPS